VLKRKEELNLDNMEIKNFTLGRFARQNPDLISSYVTALQYVRPYPTNKKIISLKLREVEFIKSKAFGDNQEDILKIVSLVQGISEKKVLKIKIIKFYGLLNSIRKQLERIYNAEKNGLESEQVNVAWEMVNGSEKMAKFGILNTLEDLSGGDATKYEYYLEQKYSWIFSILRMRKTAKELSIRMSKIKTPN